MVRIVRLEHFVHGASSSHLLGRQAPHTRVH